MECEVDTSNTKVEKIDVSKLHSLSEEVIGRQATINFGTIGHVAHGKSTVVRAISGVQTVRFKNEKERNITIKLGYANAKIFKCESGKCEPPKCYSSGRSDSPNNILCQHCHEPMKLIRHVSFVDCPGHDILMATMLNGAAVMDAALLLIAANESCPQPQTSEHLAAVEILRLKHIIILQNKIELVKESQALQQHAEIKQFVAGTSAGSAPIIPISAIMKLNIDVLCEYIVTQVPVPARKLSDHPQMIIIRSFDVNKPGEEIDDLQGGVAGGSILRGVLQLGDEIEIRPGIVTKTASGTVSCRPIVSQIVSMYAEQNTLKFAIPGGLIGVGTRVDPTLTRADRLVGQILGHPGYLPDCFIKITVTFYLLKRVLGMKSQDAAKTYKVSKLKKSEFLMINIGATSVGGRIDHLTDTGATMTLFSPVCAEINGKVALSRKVDKHWRLIGFGTIQEGTSIEVVPSL